MTETVGVVLRAPIVRIGFPPRIDREPARLDLLTRIRTDIDKRLEELRHQIEEIPRLEAALKALDEADGRAPTRQRRSSGPGRKNTANRRGSRKRAPRGQNREAILRVISERHGVSAGEVANATRIAKPTVYSTISKLLKEGAVKRTKDGGLTGA